MNIPVPELYLPTCAPFCIMCLHAQKHALAGVLVNYTALRNTLESGPHRIVLTGLSVGHSCCGRCAPSISRAIQCKHCTMIWLLDCQVLF